MTTTNPVAGNYDHEALEGFLTYLRTEKVLSDINQEAMDEWAATHGREPSADNDLDMEQGGDLVIAKIARHPEAKILSAYIHAQGIYAKANIEHQAANVIPFGRR